MLSVLRNTWALLFGFAIICLGHGLQGTLIGVRSVIEGFSFVSAGFIIAGYYVGYLSGAIAIPILLKRTGHIRVFAALASLASISILLHSVFLDPFSWFMIRIITGVSLSGIYVIMESWLNDKSTNQTRGKLLSIYMIITFTFVGLGQLLLNLSVMTLLLSVGYSECNESNWQEYYPDMQGCDLQNANLSYENLEGVDLTYADLSFANLSYADLTFANITYADLYYTNLYGANLGGAYLVGSNFYGANLEGACLEGAIGFTQINPDYNGTPILEGCASFGGDCSFEDTDKDGYDDASYDAGFDGGYEIGATSGDMNLDEVINVADIIALVNIIIGD